ncbi:MAG: hypothetical protein HRT88_05815 [Lentisphaeraceae bacterium]|nr:hypothetical protein [Lentisphaeraceae bacterium]
MYKVCDVIERMKDQLYRLESIVNESRGKDFDGARDLIREHQELLSELSSQLAAAEDRWRQEQD